MQIFLKIDWKHSSLTMLHNISSKGDGFAYREQPSNFKVICVPVPRQTRSLCWASCPDVTASNDSLTAGARPSPAAHADWRLRSDRGGGGERGERRKKMFCFIFSFRRCRKGVLMMALSQNRSSSPLKLTLIKDKAARAAALDARGVKWSVFSRRADVRSVTSHY